MFLNKLIKEEIKSQQLTEGFFDKVLNHITKVVDSGRIKHTTKEISKENPELAKAFATFMSDADEVKKKHDKMSVEDKERLEDLMNAVWD